MARRRALASSLRAISAVSVVARSCSCVFSSSLQQKKKKRRRRRRNNSFVDRKGGVAEAAMQSAHGIQQSSKQYEGIDRCCCEAGIFFVKTQMATTTVLNSIDSSLNNSAPIDRHCRTQTPTPIPTPNTKHLGPEPAASSTAAKTHNKSFESVPKMLNKTRHSYITHTYTLPTRLARPHYSVLYILGLLETKSALPEDGFGQHRAPSYLLVRSSSPLLEATRS